MSRKSNSQVFVAIVCGACTMLILSAGYYVDLAMGLTMDGREIFLTVGAALGGPWAAVIMSIFMAIGIFIGYPQITGLEVAVDALGHLTGLILFALLYKKIRHERLNKPVRALSWMVLIPIYYWILLVPIASVLYYAIGKTPSPLFLYTLPIWPEAVITTVLTTMIMAALPPKWRKPLWGSSGITEEIQSVVGIS